MISVERLFKIAAVLAGINIVFIIGIIFLAKDNRLFCSYSNVEKGTFGYLAAPSHIKPKSSDASSKRSNVSLILDYYAAIFFSRGAYNGIKFSTDRYVCSGTIIAYQWILTTARCMNYLRRYSIPLQNVYVKTQIDSLDGAASRHQIRHFINHEDFLEHYKVDIGLIRIHAPPLLSEIVTDAPIPLAEQEYTYVHGSTCSIQGISKNSRQFEKIELKIIDSNKCQKSPNIYREITSYRFCAKFPPNKTSCIFPVGTAVIQSNRIIGLNIDSNCNKTEDPAIFIKVSYFYKWVRRKCTDYMCWA